MSIRRFVLLALLLFPAVFGAAACATAPPESAPATPPEAAPGKSDRGVVSVRLMGPRTARAPDRQAIAYCEKRTGVRIDLAPGPESAAERLALYRQLLDARSDDVDLLPIDVIWAGILAQHLVDFNPYMAEAEKSAYLRQTVGSGVVDGRRVGLPWSTDVGLLYYRTDLLEKYGYARPPETWAELEEMAATIQAGERAEDPDFWGYVWQGNVYEGLTCNALEWQASWGGGTIVEADGAISIDNPRAAAALDRAAGWVGVISPPGVVSYQEEDARSVWQAGHAAFMRNWAYAYRRGQAEDSPIKGLFDVTVLPQGGGTDARHAGTLGGWQVSVSRYSRHVDAAAEVAICLAGREAQKIRATGDGSLPAIADLYADPDVLEANPFYGQLRDILADSAVARPSTVVGDQYNLISSVYFTEVNRVLTGAQTGREAVARMEEQIRGLLR